MGSTVSFLTAHWFRTWTQPIPIQLNYLPFRCLRSFTFRNGGCRKIYRCVVVCESNRHRTVSGRGWALYSNLWRTKSGGAFSIWRHLDCVITSFVFAPFRQSPFKQINWDLGWVNRIHFDDRELSKSNAKPEVVSNGWFWWYHVIHLMRRFKEWLLFFLFILMRDWNTVIRLSQKGNANDWWWSEYNFVNIESKSVGIRALTIMLRRSINYLLWFPSNKFASISFQTQIPFGNIN